MSLTLPLYKWYVNFQRINEKLTSSLQNILFLKLIHICTYIAILFKKLMVKKSCQNDTASDHIKFPKKSQFSYHIRWHHVSHCASHHMTSHLTSHFVAPITYHIATFFWSWSFHVVIWSDVMTYPTIGTNLCKKFDKKLICVITKSLFSYR